MRRILSHRYQKYVITTDGMTYNQRMINQSDFSQGLSQKLGLVDVDFYVDDINGNNSNDGSQAFPFKTLQHALDAGPSCPNGEYRIHLIGVGPYILPDYVKGVYPSGTSGEPLMILGDEMTSVYSGTVSTVSGAEVTIASATFVPDEYRNLVYHGLSGASAGRYYTISANDVADLTSLGGTFHAAAGDTFEILKPTTLLSPTTANFTEINGGRVGFYACEFQTGALTITGATVLLDACLMSLTSNFVARDGARFYSCATSFSREFFSITDVGTQSGSTGACFSLPSDSQCEITNQAFAYGYFQSNCPWLIDTHAVCVAYGVDVAIDGSAGTFCFRVDHRSQLKNAPGWIRLVGNGAGCIGLDVIRSSSVDFGNGSIDKCGLTAVYSRIDARASLSELDGSIGNGAGLILESGGCSSIGPGMFLTGQAGDIIVDGSSVPVTWTQASPYISSHAG